MTIICSEIHLQLYSGILICEKIYFLPHFLVNSDFFLPQKICKINLSDFLREFKKNVNLIIVLFICGFKLSQ